MVTDFGIAKVRDNSDRTQTGTMLGSVKYVSPEQVEGKPVDPRSDVYSLGVVLYEALTGQAPFVADTPAATALARLHATPPHPGQVRHDAPPALADLIMRAMALDPAQRFATASDVRAALLAIRLDPRGARRRPHRGRAPTDGSPQRPHPGASRRTPATPPPPPPGLPPPPPRPISQARWGALIFAAALIAFALIVAAILIRGTASNGGGSSPTILRRRHDRPDHRAGRARRLARRAHRGAVPRPRGQRQDRRGQQGPLRRRRQHRYQLDDRLLPGPHVRRQPQGGRRHHRPDRTRRRSSPGSS